MSPIFSKSGKRATVVAAAKARLPAFRTWKKLETFMSVKIISTYV